MSAVAAVGSVNVAKTKPRKAKPDDGKSRRRLRAAQEAVEESAVRLSRACADMGDEEPCDWK